MKVAIMQPYFFPYFGYWQLIKAVDTFVFFDDVNYIQKGFINRNSLLVNGRPKLFTLELIGASQNKKINEIIVGGNRPKILKMIQFSYKKASHYENFFPVVESILTNREQNLAKYIGNSIKEVSRYLGLEREFIFSSSLNYNRSGKGQDKILSIVEHLGGKQYVNLPGGINLYEPESFKDHDIELSFLQADDIHYSQGSMDFVPNLSIVDFAMRRSSREISSNLNHFKLR